MDSSLERGGNTNRMANTSTGDVGVGTLTPSRELEITGGGDVYVRITEDLHFKQVWNY